MISRAYDNQLFTSGQGTFSCRLPDNSMIITPYAMDRKYLNPEDLVLVRETPKGTLRKEAGKIPSRSLLLHHEIYRQHPGIGAVIVAHPPNIMAFAVTECSFDARLIPESYIMLRTVAKYPFGCTFLEPDRLAEELREENPVAIIENDCVITTGETLLKAFDRLEVMEYSAKSVIDAASLGGIVKISSAEVDDIEDAFGLH